jgi:hypothetical protein
MPNLHLKVIKSYSNLYFATLLFCPSSQHKDYLSISDVLQYQDQFDQLLLPSHSFAHNQDVKKPLPIAATLLTPCYIAKYFLVCFKLN